MQAELLMIGTELLLGQIQDTNAAYLGRLLAENGINLYQKTTVGDNRGRIVGAMDAALTRADAVLCSGGLGPTEDDITRDCIADLLGAPLVYREDLFEAIRARFAHARRPITENNKRQATLPEGAIPIENPNGTAPGLIIEDTRPGRDKAMPGVIVCMPGVPHELEAMFSDSVLPYLRGRFGISGVLHYRVLKVCGIGESRVDSLIGDLIQAQENPTIGLLASPGAVRIRIAARAASIEEADALIDPVEAAVCERLPGKIIGHGDATLEGVVDELIRARGWRLAVAETLSGGALSQRLTAIKARSFAGGWVLPGDAAGSTVEAAFDLASRCLLHFEADSALALVCDAVAGRSIGVFVCPEGQIQWEVGFYGSTPRNQIRTSVVSLEQVRRFLIGDGSAR